MNCNIGTSSVKINQERTFKGTKSAVLLVPLMAVKAPPVSFLHRPRLTAYGGQNNLLFILKLS